MCITYRLHLFWKLIVWYENIPELFICHKAILRRCPVMPNKPTTICNGKDFVINASQVNPRRHTRFAMQLHGVYHLGDVLDG